MRKHWIQHPITHKLIPADEYSPPTKKEWAYIQGDIKPFVSPITKEVITDRGQLRRHMKQHGVTRSDDYSDEYMAKRRKKRMEDMYGTSKEAKKERVQTIQRILGEYGI